MVRNREKRGTISLGAFAKSFRELLPSGWEVTPLTPVDRQTAYHSTKEFHVSAPDGTKARIVAIDRPSLTPATVKTTINQVAYSDASRRAASGPHTSYVVVAPFVSPRSQELLSDAGIGWFDATGNMHVQTDRPALYFESCGKSRDPNSRPDDRRLKSLKGPKAARVVRTLLDSSGSIGVRDLASESKVGQATSARVLEYLDRESLISRSAQGTVTNVQKKALLQSWTRDYGVTSSHRVVPSMSARGIDYVLRQLPSSGLSYAITGSATTPAYLPAEALPVAPTSLLMVYVEDVSAAQIELKVRPADRGINVFLIEPFDDIVYQGARTINGLQYVAPSQAIADLLTAPGRSDEEAEQLLELVPFS